MSHNIMKIYKDFKPTHKNCGFKTVATLGTFDGVHIGHRHILNQVITKAKQVGIKAVIITFDRHPGSIIKPDYSPKLLTTLDEKLAIFEKIGIDITFVLTFTKHIADMTADQFIKEYLIDCLGMNYFIVGYDHSLGKDRATSSEKLKEHALKLNFNLEIIQPIQREKMIVNSSTIRNHVLEGRVDLASVLLGEDYSFLGQVVEGRGIGKEIGFPTANIVLKNTGKIIPANGVYAGWIEIEHKKRYAVITIGPKPTFDLKEELIEIHIPDYEADLYKKILRVGFVRKLRNIEKFESKQALILQIKDDIDNSKHLIINKIYN